MGPFQELDGRADVLRARRLRLLGEATHPRTGGQDRKRVLGVGVRQELPDQVNLHAREERVAVAGRLEEYDPVLAAGGRGRGRGSQLRVVAHHQVAGLVVVGGGKAHCLLGQRALRHGQDEIAVKLGVFRGQVQDQVAAFFRGLEGMGRTFPGQVGAVLDAGVKR